MVIGIATISQKNPSWIEQGFQAYCQRCPKPWDIEHHHIALHKRTPGRERQALDKEAAQVLKLAQPTHLLIGLDPLGIRLDSYEFADRIQQTLNLGQKPLFVIGAPEGLTAELRQQCKQLWSLGPLTMPHTLAKVVLAEQIFRAWSIVHQHPYHRQ